MKTRRVRLLDLLAARYPETPRESLLASVLCGDVRAGGEKVRDPKRLVPEDAEIGFSEEAFVSRGGGKLEGALSAWNVDVAGKVVLDAGSSTGGFTDCLLKRGAALVHAVDSGRNQLHGSLRGDPRVRLRERTNIMAVDRLDPVPDFAVCDLSFRSLRGAARHIAGLTRGGTVVALVKPQFEWQNPPADFDGVVRRDDDLGEILTGLAASLEEEGLRVADAAESPVRGRSGNREFFFLLETGGPGKDEGGAGIREKIGRLVRGSP